MFPTRKYAIRWYFTVKILCKLEKAWLQKSMTMVIWQLSPVAWQLWHTSFESLPKGQLSVQLSKPHPIWNGSVERGYRSQPEDMRECQPSGEGVAQSSCSTLTEDNRQSQASYWWSSLHHGKCSGRGASFLTSAEEAFLVLGVSCFCEEPAPMLIRSW